MNVGDLVELKSGGPRMTVIDAREEGDRFIITCSWAANGIVQTQAFPPAALKVVPEEINPRFPEKTNTWED